MKAILQSAPPALVLGLRIGGLATARCLKEEGVEVHAVALSRDCPGRLSSCCKVTSAAHLGNDERSLVEWVQNYAANLPQPPVVFPTNDRTALMLARNKGTLQQSCRIWNTPYKLLLSLIQKDLLYNIASSKGVLVPPNVISPNVEQLR